MMSEGQQMTETQFREQKYETQELETDLEPSCNSIENIRGNRARNDLKRSQVQIRANNAEVFRESD